MITLHSLPSLVKRRRKRVGRGRGSGKGGHTVGRGQKGQKSRTKIALLFEGTKTKKSLIQRLPLLRGRGKLKARRKAATVTVDKLNAFLPGSRVDVAALVEKGIVDKSAAGAGVKVLGGGKLDKKLTVGLPASAGARDAIEAAGGSLE